MAGEVEEPIDPIQAILNDHQKRMGEIATAGFNKAQGLCDESLIGIKKSAGLKATVIDKALQALGIVDPAK